MKAPPFGISQSHRFIANPLKVGLLSIPLLKPGLPSKVLAGAGSNLAALFPFLPGDPLLYAFLNIRAERWLEVQMLRFLVSQKIA